MLGQQDVKKFDHDRLIVAEQCDKPDVSIYEPVRKNNAPTFATLHQVVKHTKDRDQNTVMKADINIFRRLITSYEAHQRNGGTYPLMQFSTNYKVDLHHRC